MLNGVTYSVAVDQTVDCTVQQTQDCHHSEQPQPADINNKNKPVTAEASSPRCLGGCIG